MLKFISGKNNIEINEFTLTPPKELFNRAEKASNSPSKLTLCHFSDTHFGPYFSEKDFSPLAELINSKSCDFIFFTGDLFDKYSVKHPFSFIESHPELEEIFKNLYSRYGKYAVLGNHDYNNIETEKKEKNPEEHINGDLNNKKSYKSHHKCRYNHDSRMKNNARTPDALRENRVIDFLNACDFKVLRNDILDFPALNLSIAGIDDMLYKKSNTEICKDLSVSNYNILLSHEPDIAESIKECPVDLALSGHTHGKQINLPFIYPRYLNPDAGKKYIGGFYDLTPGDSLKDIRGKLYVNRGLGTTLIPFRYKAKPELTFIEINFE